MLPARKSRREKRVARIGALASKNGNRQFGKLSSFGWVFGVAFVVDGQLFARVRAVVRIGSNFQPDRGGVRVFAAALGHHRKLAARLGTDFHRQPHRQSFCARGVRAIVLSPALKEPR